MYSPQENTYLYSAVESCRMMIAPFRTFFQMESEWIKNPLSPLMYSGLGANMGAMFELMERTTRQYNKPEFNIKETYIGNVRIPIEECVVIDKPFCRLLHFKKMSEPSSKEKTLKILIVAPMAGHYSTLLRGTVESMLPYGDVYITDWKNARDVPATDGDFGFEEYVSYCLEFFRLLGPDFHVVAVCQPTVPVLAAIALMSEKKDPATPHSMTLIGGPIDTRQSPTEVNNFAVEKTLKWFRSNMISRVPWIYPGFTRRVYPGFVQLSGFMAMNMYKHVGEHIKLYNHLVQGDGESADTHRAFYNEYLSVMDLPANFFIETVKAVFKDHLLPLGKMYIQGHRVDPSTISRVGLLVVEGEKDDISGIGQTKAAITLCTNIPEKDTHYHLQPEVGHYGTFNGRRYREEILPVIVQFMQRMDKTSK